MSEGNLLPAVVENYSIMSVSTEELAEIVRENIGVTGMSHLDLDRVRVPAAGGTTWSVPTLDGESLEKVLRGVMVYQTVARAYWESSFEDGGGSPPSCYSNDGQTGQGMPGGDCASCKYNQWGSDRRGGQGKACRELRLLFLMQEQNLLPAVVVLPPTSVKLAHQFLIRLASRGVPYYGVVTEITLEKEKSKSGISYAKAKFQVGGRLNQEQTAKMRAYKTALQPMLQRVVVTQSDVDQVHDSEDVDF